MLYQIIIIIIIASETQEPFSAVSVAYFHFVRYTCCTSAYVYIYMYIRTPKRQTQMQKLPLTPFSAFWYIGVDARENACAQRVDSHLAECIPE